MSSNKNRRILITGATGYLGSYISRCMVKEGYRNVVAIHRPGSKFDLVEEVREQIEWKLSSLDDYDVLDEIISKTDIVIHAAALVSFNPSDSTKLFKTNVDGTRILVNLSLKHKIEKFIYISSIAAIGRSPEIKMISEESEWVDSKYNTRYGKSKHYGEREVWRAHAEGLPVVVINPSFVLGAGYWDSGTMNIFSRIFNGLKYYPVGSNGVVDVRDVAYMTIKTLQIGIQGMRIISSAENINLGKLFSLIAREFEKKSPSIPISKWMGAFAWRLEFIKSMMTRKHPIMTKESLRVASYPSEYDNTRSIMQLNFEYRPLQDTIRETCQCYLNSYRESKNFGILNLP